MPALRFVPNQAPAEEAAQTMCMSLIDVGVTRAQLVQIGEDATGYARARGGFRELRQARALWDP